MNTAQARLNAGLCPQCGKDAAPYRLCVRCRALDQVRRFARRGAACGALSYEPDPADRRRKLVAIKDDSKRDEFSFASPGFAWTMDPEVDRRFRPRLRGVPVDVAGQVVEIFRARGEPMTEQEIMAAWGRLRVKPDRESAARDVVRIIEADRRREVRAGRRRPR